MVPLALRSILVATDLSPSGDAALRAGLQLAERSGAALHVVHALDVPIVPYLQEHFPAAALRRQVLEAEAALDERVRELAPEGFRAHSCAVFLATPARVILERADVVKADVLVLGPHRARAVGDKFLGTTADRVMQESPRPCLVVRESFELPLRRVLAPVDLSTRASLALDQALLWAQRLGGDGDAIGLPGVEVRVVHVIPRIFQNKDFPFDRAVIGPELSREVGAAVQRTGVASRVAVREEVLWGNTPADDLVRYAGEHAADLLVMGTHGAGTVRRALIGSVASGVTRAAPCPVLLVPGTLPQEATPLQDAVVSQTTAS